MMRLILHILTIASLCLVLVTVVAFAITDDLTFLVWSCFFSIHALILRGCVE